ncbi:MAG: NAD-dependent malic enzyme [Parcubacteria group bacterium CG10_big_fil_rev_8_21_14_0_10_36_14]|nr:MAG: NAD-dependent malic enzyme [Parcubacteria group bacterium CG10_big_fil_rev_8_21_14_0_10_36_14]
MSLKEEALEFHRKNKGKLEIKSMIPLKTREDLSLAYTPGVAFACQEIAANKEMVYEYTSKGRLVAIVTDGSAVLGLGNIGAEASLPVMEGKAQLFKEFGGVDAFPIALKTQDTEEIIKIVKNISPVFGGINLEDISAPRCFEIEERLINELNIPVFHDDQHGTAIVVLAGLTNASKLANKKISEMKIVINGAGAAGMAVAKILFAGGAKNIILLDSRGIIWDGREEGMNKVKDEMAKITNMEKLEGGLAEAVKGSDVFIGVSQPNILTKEMVRSMNDNPIIFAMANPIPEIMPDEAHEAGANLIATGRSDFPNQINNVLAFPGLFRGVLQNGIKKITMEMKLSAAKALADYIKEPTSEYFIPGPFDEGVAEAVAKSIIN